MKSVRNRIADLEASQPQPQVSDAPQLRRFLREASLIGFYLAGVYDKEESIAWHYGRGAGYENTVALRLALEREDGEFERRHRNALARLLVGFGVRLGDKEQTEQDLAKLTAALPPFFRAGFE